MVRGNVTWRLAPAGAALVMLLAACPKAGSSYDPALEAASSDWKTQIGTFITGVEEKAGTPAGEYQSNKQFYVDIQSTIEGHVTRTKSGGSQKAVEILQLLSKDIENLRKLHESGGKTGLTPAVGEPARAAIETELRALNKLETEYRSGPETPATEAPKK